MALAVIKIVSVKAAWTNVTHGQAGSSAESCFGEILREGKLLSGEER